MRGRAGEIDSAITARRQDDDLSTEPMQRSVHQRPRPHPAAPAIDHDEIENEILDEKLCPNSQGLPIQRVDQSMSRSIRSSARAWDRILAEVAHMATERPLIDFPFFSA